MTDTYRAKVAESAIGKKRTDDALYKICDSD